MHSRGFRNLICLLPCTGLGFLSPAVADTLSVCSSGCDYSDIQSAINDASDGDVIEIAAGTYRPGSTLDTLGKAITLKGEVDASGEPLSVLSGDTDGDGTRDIRVVQCVNGETNATAFEDLMIMHGTDIDDNGGSGLLADGASPSFENCWFIENDAPNGGTGASEGGAAIRFQNTTDPVIRNCHFIDNSTDTFGGAIKSNGGTLSVYDSIFTSNFGYDDGGAISTNSQSLLSGCTFEQNQAIGNYASAVVCWGSGPSVIENCEFLENYGADSTVEISCETTIRDCLFKENQDSWVVSAVYGGNDLVIEGCEFSDNTGSYGGAVISLGDLLMDDCVITNNRGTGVVIGGGLVSNSRICGNDHQVEMDGEFDELLDADGGGNCIAVNCDSDGDGLYDCIDPCPEYPLPYDCSGSGDIVVPVGASIQVAVDLIPDGGYVFLEPGEHVLHETIDPKGKTIILDGPHPADPFVPEVTISGDSDGDGVGDLRLIQFVDGEGPLTLVRFIRFTKGRDAIGGAVLVDRAHPHFEYCVFDDNEALESGGAVFVRGNSQPDFMQCRFQDNRATEDGGAVMVAGSEELLFEWITFSDCRFIANTARLGGALMNRRPAGGYNSVSFEGCTIDENTAEFGGGVFTGDLAGTQLRGSRVRNNHATSGLGGGLESAPFWGWHTVKNTEFCGNQPEHIDGTWLDEGGNSFLLGCPEEISADIDGNGRVDGADMGLLIARWGPCLDESCAEDINGDGEVNGGDLGILIASWSQ